MRAFIKDVTRRRKTNQKCFLNFDEQKNVNFFGQFISAKIGKYTNSKVGHTAHTHLSLSLSLSLFFSFPCSKIFSEVRRRGNDAVA